MPTALTVILAIILIVSAGIWLGGYLTLPMVSLISARTLEAEARVKFFKRFGRAYFTMAGVALVVALAVGWVFLAQIAWTPQHTRIAVASSALVLNLAAGVIQARDLTRRRARLVEAPGDARLARSIKTRASLATGLRALIGVFSLGIVIQVAILLVG